MNLLKSNTAMENTSWRFDLHLVYIETDEWMDGFTYTPDGLLILHSEFKVEQLLTFSILYYFCNKENHKFRDLLELFRLLDFSAFDPHYRMSSWCILLFCRHPCQKPNYLHQIFMILYLFVLWFIFLSDLLCVSKVTQQYI